jgi:glycosyltransferase involved in cell wall biosynthesis
VTLPGFRPVAVVPSYDNPRTVRAVVEALRRHLSDVIVVDDGSGPDGRQAIEALGADGLARTVRLDTNRGKGGAVQAGFAAARSLGFSHVLQVDADGQHDLADVPAFLEAARAQPEALILGAPAFDQSAPWGRLAGRQLTVFWTHVEIGGTAIADPMCGFRVYPLAAIEGLRCGLRMDFDIEIAVKLVWRGTPVINLPTKVRYVTAADGGVSHFRMFEDNLRITLLHFRLVALALIRLLRWPFRARRR